MYFIKGRKLMRSVGTCALGVRAPIIRGVDDLVGSIEVGKRADIVFADKDLNREIVMIGGKMIIE